MTKAAAIVICLLGLLVSGQAMFLSISANTTSGLICKNETLKVDCDNATQTQTHPNVCCNFGAGDVCCAEIPELVGIIVGAVVACCLLCLLLPLAVILLCCFCMGAACCGGTGNKMRIVKSGYQRV